MLITQAGLLLGSSSFNVAESSQPLLGISL